MDGTKSLGIRHCAQKPTIHLIKTGQLPPFDLGGSKVIFVDETYVTVTKAIEDIKTRIEAIENDPNLFYSQVHVHIELKKLQILEQKQGGMATRDPLVPLFSDMVATQREMSEQIGKLTTVIAAKPKTIPTPNNIYADLMDSYRSQLIKAVVESHLKPEEERGEAKG